MTNISRRQLALLCSTPVILITLGCGGGGTGPPDNDVLPPSIQNSVVGSPGQVVEIPLSFEKSIRGSRATHFLVELEVQNGGNPWTLNLETPDPNVSVSQPGKRAELLHPSPDQGYQGDREYLLLLDDLNPDNRTPLLPGEVCKVRVQIPTQAQVGDVARIIWRREGLQLASAITGKNVQVKKGGLVFTEVLVQ